ncbi:MAG TPA: histidinol-phosphate transaminase [Candidatus Sulfotelmatobacter sp.]|nr:histidinol-phosphate transaminase [Candidatus Sulfotelmatobacter sp.]
MLRPRETVLAVPPYHPPLADRSGLRLDFNENTLGCSPRVLDSLRRLTADDLARYPEKHNGELKMADFLRVSVPEVLLTNGVDEAIHLLCQTYLSPGDQAVIVVPTYSMYRIYMTAVGAEVVSVPAARNFEFPWTDVRKSMNQRTKLIAIANPNNPTGRVVPPDDLLRLAEEAPSAAVLVDEAYFEFYGHSVLSRRKQYPNLFVARTFSKAYGLAGLRLGALVGNADQMSALRRMCSPYNVNGIALACLSDALDDRVYVEQYVRDVLESRARLERTLDNAGLTFWPSQANFVLMKAGSTSASAAQFADSMRKRGVLVRDRSADFGCEGCVRITLGTRQHADKLLEALLRTLDELRIPQGVAQL